MRRRRRLWDVAAVNYDHSTKPTVLLVASHQLDILCFCTAAHLLRRANTSNALLKTAGLALFGAPRRHHLHPKSLHRKSRGSRVFSDQLLVANPVSRPCCKPYHCGISFTSAFLRLLHDADSCESGPMKHRTLSICYEGLYQRLRHLGLIAGTDGCKGRVGGVRQ